MVDPLAAIARRWTPYQYASNDPVNSIDLDGLERLPVRVIPHNRMSPTNRIKSNYLYNNNRVSNGTNKYIHGRVAHINSQIRAQGGNLSPEVIRPLINDEHGFQSIPRSSNSAISTLRATGEGVEQITDLQNKFSINGMGVRATVTEDGQGNFAVSNINTELAVAQLEYNTALTSYVDNAVSGQVAELNELLSQAAGTTDFQISMSLTSRIQGLEASIKFGRSLATSEFKKANGPSPFTQVINSVIPSLSRIPMGSVPNPHYNVEINWAYR